MKHYTPFAAILMLIALMSTGCSDDPVTPQPVVNDDPVVFEWDQEINEQVVGFWRASGVAVNGIPRELTDVMEMDDQAEDIGFAIFNDGTYLYREAYLRGTAYVTVFEVEGDFRTGGERFEIIADERAMEGTWDRVGDFLILHMVIDGQNVDLSAVDSFAN